MFRLTLTLRSFASNRCQPLASVHHLFCSRSHLSYGFLFFSPSTHGAYSMHCYLLSGFQFFSLLLHFFCVHISSFLCLSSGNLHLSHIFIHSFFLYLLERCLQPLSASFYFSLVSSPPHLFSTIISFIFYSLTLFIFLLFNNFNSTPLLKCHPCVLLKWLCSFFLQVTILSLCPILHVHCPLSFMSTDMRADVLKESVLVCLCMRRWNIEDKRE